MGRRFSKCQAIVIACPAQKRTALPSKLINNFKIYLFWLHKEVWFRTSRRGCGEERERVVCVKLLYCSYRMHGMNELRVNKVIALTRTQNNKKALYCALCAYLFTDGCPSFAARASCLRFSLLLSKLISLMSLKLLCCTVHYCTVVWCCHSQLSYRHGSHWRHWTSY